MSYRFDGQNYIPSPVPTNIKTAFIDSADTLVYHAPNQSRKYNTDENILKNGVFKINIKVGSDFEEFKRSALYVNSNRILRNRSIIISSDSEINHKDNAQNKNIFPFYDYNDVDVIKRKNKVVKVDFERPIGVINSTDFFDYKNSIYKDIESKTKILVDIIDEEYDDFIYPWVLNDYDIDKSGHCIDIFDNINEIKKSSLYYQKIKGIKSNLGSTDVRSRNIRIDNFIDTFNDYKTEHYLEHGEDSLLYRRKQFQKSGKFVKEIVNNVLDVKYDITLNDIKNTENNELLYFSNDSESYKDIPFIDRDNIYFKEVEDLNKTPRETISDSTIKSYYQDTLSKIIKDKEQYQEGIKYNSHGRDFDYSISNGVDSIAFIGGLD